MTGVTWAWLTAGVLWLSAGAVVWSLVKGRRP